MLSSQSKLQVICSKPVFYDMQPHNAIPTEVCSVTSANIYCVSKIKHTFFMIFLTMFIDMLCSDVNILNESVTLRKSSFIYSQGHSVG